jgi:hypothetical protein
MAVSRRETLGNRGEMASDPAGCTGKEETEFLGVELT